MSGGGGGSILSMIQSLRNNKNLLRKRSSFFKQKRPYERYRKFYRKELKGFEKQVISEEKRIKIRENFKKSRQVNTLISVSLLAICLLLVFYGFNIILSQQVQEKPPSNSTNTVIFSKLKPQPYNDEMKKGILKLKDKNYFMAIGNFKRALKYEPKDLKAEYYLTKTYYLLCVVRNQTCEIAFKKVKENRVQFPDDYRFKYIEKKLKQAKSLL